MTSVEAWIYHYNAEESRQLFDSIKDIANFQKELFNSKFSFIIKSEYINYIKECLEPLQRGW